MASPQTVRSEAPRRVRPVRLCAPEVVVDRKPDGTLYLKFIAHAAGLSRQTDRSPRALGRSARPIACSWRSARGGRRGWRTITYAQTLDKVRRIGASLLTRNLSAERPIVILSGNDLEHALLGLAANYVGIPVCAGLAGLFADLVRLRQAAPHRQPADARARVRLRRRAVRARHRGGRAARRRSRGHPQSVAEPVDRCSPRSTPRPMPPTRRTTRSAPTRSRNSCSPPARPACRRA